MQDGDVMSFRIWRNMQLKKLMCFYCDHKSMDLSFTCFCSGSRLLSGEESPDEVTRLALSFSFVDID